MFVPHLLKIYFGLGLSNGQMEKELRSWDGKKIICKYSLFKKCLKKIIIFWDCFCHEDLFIVLKCKYPRATKTVDLIK